MKILLIGNDQKLKAKLTRVLGKKKYQILYSDTGEQGIDEILSGVYDAVVLDYLLPDCSGLDVVRQIRKARNSVPILMLYENCGVMEKVRGLDCGADDVLEKPFADAELAARLNAITRRKGDFIFDNSLHFSGLDLNLGTYELAENGKAIGLSNKEMEIMKNFFLHGQNIINKEELMTRMWGFETAAENNLEVYISYLRRKLSAIQSKTKIVCVKNVGYRLSTEEPA